jgi:REP element-mobilizing transposase RayT
MPDQYSPPHAKDLRRGRVLLAGQVYHVTAVTRGRQPVFGNLSAARMLVHALRDAAINGDAATLAFVVMPDHLHWLLRLDGPASLSAVVGAVKAVAAHRVGGRIWQGGFHDHAVRKDEDLAAIARYIVANPVRAGLVERVGDYPHWDAIWL